MLGTPLITFKWLTLLLTMTLFEMGQFQEGEAVQLKGFCYEKEGQWVIGKEPGMKSCCLKEEAVVFLETDEVLEAGGRVVYLEGVLENSSGKWHLIGAKKVEKRFDVWHLVLPLLIGGMIFLGWRKYRDSSRV